MNKRPQYILIFSFIFLIFFILVYFNAFSDIRATITDNLYGGGNVLDNIVILTIDDESINKIGRWPWDRDVFAHVLEKIKHAKVIGIDVSFFEKSRNDSLLQQILASMENVVLAAEINNNVFYKPIFDTEHGYVNLRTDDDGVTRGFEPNLYKGVVPFAFLIYKKAWEKDAELQEKVYMINFADIKSFRTIKIVDLLNNGHDYDFNNKFVLIGATAPNLHDSYFVPTSTGIAMPGVEIHANILQNFIKNNFLQKQGILSLMILIFMFGGMGILISRMKIYYVIPAVVFLMIVYILAVILAFNKNYILDVFYVPLFLLVSTGTGIGINYLEEKKRTAHVTNAFGKYVSKNLLNEIIKPGYDLKLGGIKKEISVFFSDIRGFTSISESMSPENLVNLLNEYLSEMTKVIIKNNGTVDKFIGDAIMAFWNAPLEEKEHTKLACCTAIEQINRLKELQKKWKKQGFPILNIGVGINTGYAIIGNVGGEERFDYTAIGDTINIASRFEGLTKIYRVNIIISESTHEAIKNEFKCRMLDTVKVKGKKIPVKIYELCISDDKRDYTRYEKALQLYFNAKFKKALKEFGAARRLNKDDACCTLFIERCKKFIKNPPPKGWDGSFEMSIK